MDVALAAVTPTVAAGTAPVEQAVRDVSWEKPVDLVAAMSFGRPREFAALNLANRGQIPNLPKGVFVETPASGTSEGPVPRTVPLPDSVVGYCRAAAEVTDTIVRAALDGNRDGAHRAVALDPTITDKPAGHAAMDELLAAHADRIGELT